MRIAIAQIDPIVGAFDSNVGKIKEAYEKACQAKARLLLTPELGICGYPPHDLVERPEIFERNQIALDTLRALTLGQTCAILVGHISRNPSNSGKAAFNTVTVLENGKAVFTQAKSLLPTYDIYDEARYFEPAPDVQFWECDGSRVAIAICEDLWANDPTIGRKLYKNDPVEKYHKGGAQLVISISASPYEWRKRDRREALHAAAAKKIGAPLLYVNQVGANDEVLFDGGSFAASADGKILGRLPLFRTSFGLVDLPLVPSQAERATWILPITSEREDTAPSDLEGLSRGLVLGIRDYFARTGNRLAILGLSGGIDSAVVAVLATKALGPENVLGVAMPSQYSSLHSLEDAEALARNLGIKFEVKPIKFMYATASRELSECRGPLAPLALENLQSRLRALVLMTLSNHYNALVLTTGNKSELAMGYCTLYGDMCGALAPIGDLFKTRVYELASYLNDAWGGLIPERSISKAPSAELRPDQKDLDTLPPYEVLDRLLADYIEERVEVVELVRRYARAGTTLDEERLRQVLRSVEVNEFKRRQSAPPLKVSTKAFGIGRRMPLAKQWHT